MKTSEELKEAVKAKYNEIAENSSSCCGDTDCCGPEYSMVGESYENIAGHVEDADLNLGCGLPVKYAGIKPGNTVVDLGSGAGNDVFVARAEVGDEGRVIGIDMAESMYKKAVANAKKSGFKNVEFRLGEIEDIPLADKTADVVVSNCVFNLVPDKSAAFRETFRILKPGGHFSISDIVVRGEIPVSFKEQAELYAGCVSGAIDLEEYLSTVEAAGFTQVDVAKERPIELPRELLDTYLSAEQRPLYNNDRIGLFSVTVNAQRPASTCC